jgi:hypothetical protein
VKEEDEVVEEEAEEEVTEEVNDAEVNDDEEGGKGAEDLDSSEVC